MDKQEIRDVVLMENYFSDNLLFCCFSCNKAKEKSSYEEFIVYLNTIVKFIEEKLNYQPPILEEV